MRVSKSKIATSRPHWGCLVSAMGRERHPSALCRTHSHKTWPHTTPNAQAASAGLAVGRLATSVAARRPTGTAAATKRPKSALSHTDAACPAHGREAAIAHQSTPGPLPMTTNHPRALAHHPRCLWGASVGLWVCISALKQARVSSAGLVSQLGVALVLYHLASA